MLISVIGAGYVGLVTAACLAHLDNEVRVVDIDAARVERLRAGDVPIHEPGLDDLVHEGLASGRLSFHADPAATHGSSLVIVAVGTLDRAGEWTVDLVEKAVTGIASDPAAPRHLVIRSTLMPGTAVRLAARVRDIDPRMRVCFNPEFTREANAVRDFLEPDRVVVGAGADADALVAELHQLYAPMGKPIMDTDLTSAETIKLASNVFLAAKISFANELARLCAATGADVHAVVDGMGLDARIGRAFLSPGPGFGGSCFPSQVRALPDLAVQYGVVTPLIAAVAPSNHQQAIWIVERLEQVSGRPVAGTRVGAPGPRRSRRARTTCGNRPRCGSRRCSSGVARTSPRSIRSRPSRASPSSPVAASRSHRADSAEAAALGADAIVVGTEWPEFGRLDWAAIAPTMRGRVIADARRIVDRVAANDAGLTVVTLGVEHAPRPLTVPPTSRRSSRSRWGPPRPSSRQRPGRAMSLPPASPITPAEVAATRRPVDQASLLPPRVFHDPDVLAFEQAAWFGRSWVYVGREEDVDRPGRYPAGGGRRPEPHRHPGRGRRGPRVPQRVPPPGIPALHRARGSAGPVPVSISRLDL